MSRQTYIMWNAAYESTSSSGALISTKYVDIELSRLEIPSTDEGTAWRARIEMRTCLQHAFKGTEHEYTPCGTLRATQHYNARTATFTPAAAGKEL